MVKPTKFAGGANNKGDKSHQIREETLVHRRECREVDELHAEIRELETRLTHQSQQLMMATSPTSPTIALHGLPGGEGGEGKELKRLGKELKDEKKQTSRLSSEVRELTSANERLLIQLDEVSKRVTPQRRGTTESEISVHTAPAESSQSTNTATTTTTAPQENSDHVRKLERDLESARIAISGLALLTPILDRTLFTLTTLQKEHRQVQADNMSLIELINDLTPDRRMRATISELHDPVLGIYCEEFQKKRGRENGGGGKKTGA